MVSDPLLDAAREHAVRARVGVDDVGGAGQHAAAGVAHGHVQAPVEGDGDLAVAVEIGARHRHQPRRHRVERGVPGDVLVVWPHRAPDLVDLEAAQGAPHLVVDAPLAAGRILEGVGLHHAVQVEAVGEAALRGTDLRVGDEDRHVAGVHVLAVQPRQLIDRHPVALAVDPAAGEDGPGLLFAVAPADEAPRLEVRQPAVVPLRAGVRVPPGRGVDHRDHVATRLGERGGRRADENQRQGSGSEPGDQLPPKQFSTTHTGGSHRSSPRLHRTRCPVPDPVGAPAATNTSRNDAATGTGCQDRRPVPAPPT